MPIPGCVSRLRASYQAGHYDANSRIFFPRRRCASDPKEHRLCCFSQMAKVLMVISHTAVSVDPLLVLATALAPVLLLL